MVPYYLKKNRFLRGFLPAFSHYKSFTSKPFVLRKEENSLQNYCKMINQYNSSLLAMEVTQTRALLVSYLNYDIDTFDASCF